MQKSSLIILVLVILSSMGVFFKPQQNHQTHQIMKMKTEFENFKIKFNRKYTLEEEMLRFKIFKDNYKLIQENNADSSKTYKMGVTKFADMTPEEFKFQILTPDLLKMRKNITIQVEDLHYPSAPPASVDWRGKNVITPVKDQGSCGSCWSFSTTGSLQAAVAMRDKTLNSYSEQQLIDCCKYAKYGCQGCSGAWPEWALEYVKDSGIVLESEYPYNGYQDTCKSIPTAKKLLNTRKPFTIIANNTDTIKNTLATSGPLSVCVDAYKWPLYVSGVFNDCHDGQTDHAVLLVGYQDDGVWIIKNSWGVTWGEEGYIRISGKGTACLVRSHVIVPHLA